MSYSVSGTTIYLTRGDSFYADIEIYDANGDEYTPGEDDTIKFAMKKDYTDTEYALEVDIPVSTMQLIIQPDDTKDLDFGTYVYDIQLTTAAGDVCTFITKAKLKLTEEVS